MQLLDREEVGTHMTFAQAVQTGQQKELPSGVWKYSISAFIVFFCFVIFNYLVDDTLMAPLDLNKIPYRAQVYSFVHQTAAALGWYQYWMLFCPEVRRSIYHETALITYTDGTMRLYEFPRVNYMDYWQRIRHDKLRKLFGDNLPWPDGVPFRPDVSRFLGLANSNPNNEPYMVHLVFNFTVNPPPDAANWNYRDHLPAHIFKDTQFIYKFQKNDLLSNASQEVGTR